MEWQKVRMPRRDMDWRIMANTSPYSLALRATDYIDRSARLDERDYITRLTPVGGRSSISTNTRTTPPYNIGKTSNRIHRSVLACCVPGWPFPFSALWGERFRCSQLRRYVVLRTGGQV